MAARAVVTDRLAAGGFLNPDFPAIDGVVADVTVVNSRSAFRPPTGHNPDPVKTYNADDLTRQNQPLLDLLRKGRIIGLFEDYFGGPVLHYNYVWFRAVSPGMGTPPHCDLVYTGRGNPQPDVDLDAGRRRADGCRRPDDPGELPPAGRPAAKLPLPRRGRVLLQRAERREDPVRGDAVRMGRNPFQEPGLAAREDGGAVAHGGLPGRRHPDLRRCAPCTRAWTTSPTGSGSRWTRATSCGASRPTSASWPRIRLPTRSSSRRGASADALRGSPADRRLQLVAPSGEPG